MHLFLLAIISLALLIGGGFVYLGEMMADTRADTRAVILSLVSCAVGAGGIVITFCWGCKLIVEAI